MGNSFSQKFFSTVFMGFAAACLLWLMRHVVEEAFHETGSGWHEMFNKPKKGEKL